MTAATDRRRARRLGIDAAAGAALRQRSRALSAVRAFFAARGFLEVDTPLLVDAPGSEAQLDPLPVGGGWLITSPEHHMKRLLSAGEDRIFQVCRCFRAGEHSPYHRTEFTMVEWYRRGADYLQIAADVEELVATVAVACTGSTTLTAADGRRTELAAPWARWTVSEAVAEFAGFPLHGPEQLARLRHAASAAGMTSIDDEDDWESAFHKILVERVEPALARSGRGVHLLDWPAPLAALAQLKSGDPTVAERVESYAGGLELSNGFSELTDARQQRRRFRHERQRRRARGRHPLPVDEAFLRALALGMPSAAGVALGFDRLLLLVDRQPDLRLVAPHFMEARNTA